MLMELTLLVFPQIEAEGNAVRAVSDTICPLKISLDRVVLTSTGVLVGCWQVFQATSIFPSLSLNLSLWSISGSLQSTYIFEISILLVRTTTVLVLSSILNVGHFQLSFQDTMIVSNFLLRHITMSYYFAFWI